MMKVLAMYFQKQVQYVHLIHPIRHKYINSGAHTVVVTIGAVLTA